MKIGSFYFSTADCHRQFARSTVTKCFNFVIQYWRERFKWNDALSNTNKNMGIVILPNKNLYFENITISNIKHILFLMIKKFTFKKKLSIFLMALIILIQVLKLFQEITL